MGAAEKLEFELDRKGRLILFMCHQAISHQVGQNLIAEMKRQIEDKDSTPWDAIVLDLGHRFNFDAGFLRDLMPLVKQMRSDQKRIYAIHAPQTAKAFLVEKGMDSAIKVMNSLKEVEAIVAPQKESGARLDVNFINPFIESTLKVLDVQCSFKAQPKKAYLAKDGERRPADIAAVIGLLSKTFNGSIAVCFPEKVFLKIMENMLGEEYSEITEELEDGAGELLNIIFGQSKIVLNEKGYGIEKAIPTIVRGKDLKVSHMTPNPALILPFDTEAGEFHIEVAIDD